MTTFDFNDGTNQGWKTIGIYDNGGLVPIPGFFAEVDSRFYDNQNSPTSPAIGDPIGNGKGAIGLPFSQEAFTPGSPSGSDYIHVDLVSPNLSKDSDWQNMSGFTYDVTGVMFSPAGECYVQTVLGIQKPDGSNTFFTDGQFHEIKLNQYFPSWKTINVEKMSIIPKKSTITDINFRVFFTPLSTYTGSVLVDNIKPIIKPKPKTQPQLLINDVSVLEGQKAKFKVDLVGPVTETVKVNYTLIGNSAKAGKDFVNSRGKLVFRPSNLRRQSQTITIPTKEDYVVENDETFRLVLSQAENAVIEVKTGKATIVNDDQYPRLSLQNVRVKEGDIAKFKVNVIGPVGETIKLQYGLRNGSAKARQDFVSSRGRLVFRPSNLRRQSQIIRVRTVEDKKLERNEKFSLVVNNGKNVNLQDKLATGIIIDDDRKVPRSNNDQLFSSSGSKFSGEEIIPYPSLDSTFDDLPGLISKLPAETGIANIVSGNSNSQYNFGASNPYSF